VAHDLATHFPFELNCRGERITPARQFSNARDRDAAQLKAFREIGALLIHGTKSSE